MALHNLNRTKVLYPFVVRPIWTNFSALGQTSLLSESKDKSSVYHQKNDYSKGFGDGDEFRVLQLIKKKRPRQPRVDHFLKRYKPPRESVQSETQDWGSVWPGVRSFHPATVPLPIRMGFPLKDTPTPDKWGNAELMKIPNFLHLTPPVIKRQCEAIKQFCTPWPNELETEEAQNYHYPMTVSTSSYVHSAPTIRDPRSRVATLRVSIDYLELDYHATDKLLRLIGDRFNPKTRMITITADRCPLSSQNLDYALYLLSVIYKVAFKEEGWENEKEADDFESYSYSADKSRERLRQLEGNASEVTIPENDVEEYIEAVSQLHDEREDDETLLRLRTATLKVLNL